MKKGANMEKDIIPEMGCSIHINNCDSFSKVIDELERIGVNDFHIIKPMYFQETICEFSLTKTKTWYLDELLSMMFLKVQDIFEQLISIIKRYKCQVVIDIWFYHEDSYPALTICRENIKKIYDMNAEISIDIN